MSNVRQMAKLNSAAAFANLARSYRLIARAMITAQSRNQLLRMADNAEEKSRQTVGTPEV